MNQIKYKYGDIVWAKMKKCPYWPGVIIEPEEPLYGNNTYKVFFYGTKNYAWIPIENLYPNCEYMYWIYKNRKRSMKGLKEAVKEMMKDAEETDDDSEESTVNQDKLSSSKQGQEVVKRYWNPKDKKFHPMEDFYRQWANLQCHAVIKTRCSNEGEQHLNFNCSVMLNKIKCKASSSDLISTDSFYNEEKETTGNQDEPSTSKQGQEVVKPYWDHRDKEFHPMEGKKKKRKVPVEDEHNERRLCSKKANILNASSAEKINFCPSTKRLCMNNSSIGKEKSYPLPKAGKKAKSTSKRPKKDKHSISTDSFYNEEVDDSRFYREHKNILAKINVYLQDARFDLNRTVPESASIIDAAREENDLLPLIGETKEPEENVDVQFENNDIKSLEQLIGERETQEQLKEKGAQQQLRGKEKGKKRSSSR